MTGSLTIETVLIKRSWAEVPRALDLFYSSVALKTKTGSVFVKQLTSGGLQTSINAVKSTTTSSSRFGGGAGATRWLQQQQLHSTFQTVKKKEGNFSSFPFQLEFQVERNVFEEEIRSIIRRWKSFGWRCHVANKWCGACSTNFSSGWDLFRPRSQEKINR